MADFWQWKGDSSNGAGYVEVLGSNTRKIFSDTILLGVSAVYTAGDVVSTDAGEVLSWDLSSLIPAGGSGVILDSVVTLNQNAVFSGGTGYTLYLFNTSPTAQAANAPFDLDSLTGYIGKIYISTLNDLGSNCAITDYSHNFSFNLATGSQTLYGKLVCNGGETTVTGKTITINLGIAAL